MTGCIAQVPPSLLYSAGQVPGGWVGGWVDGTAITLHTRH